MDVKPGYKQTEAGVIPEDWHTMPLGTVTSDIGDGIHATPVYSSNGDYYFINGNNLRNGQIVVTEETKTVDHSEFRKYRKELGGRSILMSINGTIGNLGLFTNEAVVLGKSAAYLNVKESVSKLFVYYSIQTEYVKRQFSDGLTGTTIRNLGLGTIRNTIIPLPPTRAEQEAIAEALSDADALIESLEQLIAKKRHVKQGAMQELLRPKEHWCVEKLEDIADVIDPHPSHRAPPMVPNGIPFVGIGDLNENGDLVGNKIRTVDPSVFNEHLTRYDLSEELIGLGRVASIGKVVKLKYAETKYVISPTLGVIRGTRVRRDYLLYALKSQLVDDQFNKIMSGSTRSSVGMIVLRKLDISLPPKEAEQTAIAAILSDMDAEIAALEGKLSKARQLKQGMMQELLTGRIRLVGGA